MPGDERLPHPLPRELLNCGVGAPNGHRIRQLVPGYYSVPGREVEDFICKEGDDEVLRSAKDQIEFADWTARQVRDLRKAPARLQSAARARRPALAKLLKAHPEAAAQLELAVQSG